MDVLAERGRLYMVALVIVAIMAALLAVSTEPAKAGFSCSHNTGAVGERHWHWWPGQWHTTYYKYHYWSKGRHYHRAWVMVEVPYGFENSWETSLRC